MKPFPWCIVPKTLCVFIFSFPTNLNSYCNKDKLVHITTSACGFSLTFVPKEETLSLQ
jgi:hypothetical protein